MPEQYPDRTSAERWAVQTIRTLVRVSIARGRWLRQDEDDLVHDCLVNWYENRGKWEPGRASEKTFLKRITDNYLVSLWRKKQARLQNLASLEGPFELDDEDGGSWYDLISDDGPTPDTISELADLQRRVRATMETLSGANREIAEALAVSRTKTEASERVGRTRQSLGRAERRIRRIFTADHLEDFLR